jgi:hypothetical protein
VALCVLTVPSIAHADTAIQSATSEILNILIPVFVALIGALATWILRKVQQKLHLDVGEKAAGAWSDLARKAALRGGEWARKKSKELTEGKKIPGPEVMEVAASWAVEMAKQQKLPEMARAKLEGLIEAHLFELRSAEEDVAASAPPTPPAA